jgi:hypothetical protein
MSQVLGAFGLLDFTVLQPVLAWWAFETYESFISLIFFSGHGQPRIVETVDIGARLYREDTIHCPL